ncbi:MAG: hypothetical protein IKM11_07000, partial [Oscillospiraceae bacterium]|nr:hypothetical protein [Oscillospiraceae bacterium]
MASTEKKTGGKRAAASAPKKDSTKKKTTSGSRNGAKSAAKNKNGRRPIRREVFGIVLLLLALCVLVSFFSKDGWLTDALPRLLRGLFGIGYFVTVPALVIASWILLTHRGRPVLLRTVCTLLQPYLFGILCHLLFCRMNFDTMDGLVPRLWNAGGTLECGGVLSGSTAQLLTIVLGRPLGVIVLLCLIVVLLMVTFELTISKLIQMWRERERLEYDEEDYEEYPEPVAAVPKAAKDSAAKRAQIDIPLDGPMTEAEAKESFFRPRAKDRMTPAELLEQEKEAPAVSPEPETVTEIVTPVMPEPIMQEPIAAPVEQEVAEQPEEKRRSKKPTAAEVEQATAEVTAEIESSMA